MDICIVMRKLDKKKNERKIKLLLEEIQKNPNDPYINYQLGKSYISDLKNNEALYYIEKSYDLYNKQGRTPIFVIVSLLGLYEKMKLYIKCEKLCIKYIKYDKQLYNYVRYK